MPIGKGNYNNNKKNYRPSVSSAYRFSNPTSKIDPTALEPSFWGGNLKLSIFPKKGETDKGIPVWDRDDGIAIYLTHFKAEIFKRELIEFLKNPDKYNDRGVESGSKTIHIYNGESLGATNPVIIIRLKEDGKVKREFAYEVNSDYYYGILNFNKDKPDEYEKNAYPNMEISALITLLDEYVKAVTNAQAYSIMDCDRFNFSRVNTKINLIAEKMGIQKPSYGGDNKSSRSFLQNTNNSSSENTTNIVDIDDIETMVE